MKKSRTRIFTKIESETSGTKQPVLTQKLTQMIRTVRREESHAWLPCEQIYNNGSCSSGRSSAFWMINSSASAK